MTNLPALVRAQSRLCHFLCFLRVDHYTQYSLKPFRRVRNFESTELCQHLPNCAFLWCCIVLYTVWYGERRCRIQQRLIGIFHGQTFVPPSFLPSSSPSSQSRKFKGRRKTVVRSKKKKFTFQHPAIIESKKLSMYIILYIVLTFFCLRVVGNIFLYYMNQLVCNIY